MHPRGYSHAFARPACLLAGLALGLGVPAPLASANPQTYGNVSAPAIIQVFESRWDNLEWRGADAFIAGYGGLWVPPPARADSGDHSVGYDVFDRFDLGRPGRQTLYGTETSLRTMVGAWQRFGASVYADLIWNHNGFRDNSTPGFIAAGGYPGFVLTHPSNQWGDFHDPAFTDDLRGRLAGLIDIDQTTNHRYIRNPVDPGDTRNIPAGHTWNVPDAANRRFYPSHDNPGRTLFDPATGEWFTVHDFRGDGSEIADGTPVEENALGLLMRNAQWMIQDIGFDGFRLDAAKHVYPWAFNYLDRAVYGAHPRPQLDGSQRHVFSFGEVYDGSHAVLQQYVRKDISPATPNVVGGNRDALDFPLHFALKQNLSHNGLQNDWRNVVNASFDVNDDGLANNGSQGVAFDASHDDFGADLSNVSNAYLAMRPGNWVVYHNAKQFGDRDFPKDGRGDALGGLYGETITTLVNIRNTHGRGDYQERWLDKEVLVYERQNSAIIGLSNRSDGGFDERWVDTGFAPGTLLIEMTGNAADSFVDPYNDIPEVVQVSPDGRIPVRTPRNSNPDGDFHGRGYVIYGLPTPQGELSLTNVAQVISGGTPTPQTNGTTRLADLHVITEETFQVRLQTEEVYLLGLSHLRDPDADGDNALFKINAGIDANRNGHVDHVTPGSVAYGFEHFLDKSSPLALGGDGEFVQTIHTQDLVEGLNFVEVRAFRARDDGGPPVFSTFRKVLYVDLLPPESEFAGLATWDGAPPNHRQFRARSVDQTADNMHMFLNVPASVSDEEILSWVGAGNQAGQIDRDLWAYGWDDLVSGNHALTVVTYEITGNHSVQRFPGIAIQTGIGLGLGDLNHDGQFTAADVYGPGGFEQYLYSQDTQYNPAGDITGDGRIRNADLFALRPLYASHNAMQAAAEARQAEIRRGDLNQSGTTDASDIDLLYTSFGSTAWIFDLDDDGVAGQGDVDVLVRQVFLTEYGDATLDGSITLQDLLIVRSNFGQPGGWAQGDFTGTGFVGLQDLLLVRQNFGFGTRFWRGPNGYDGPEWDYLFVIPEPGAASGLLLGWVLLTIRPARPRSTPLTTTIPAFFVARYSRTISFPIRIQG